MTPAKRRVYDALVRITSDGWPATVREIMAEAGLVSPSTAFYHLLDLEVAGLIERNPRHVRGGWRPVSGEDAGA